jgi:predicted  nucleic acid-binding Zn-ribbon protein
VSNEEAQKLEERIVALERKVQDLTGGYKDLAYEFTDALVKRIEDIRKEVMESLNNVEERVYSEASEKIAEAVGKARQNFDRNLSAALDEHKRKILPALVDPSTGRLRHH